MNQDWKDKLAELRKRLPVDDDFGLHVGPRDLQVAEWTKFFDKIYLINLPERKDRLEKSYKELLHYQIPFEIIKAIKYNNGAHGLFQTMLGIFNSAIENNYNNILIFEDDVQLADNVNEIMKRVVKELPSDYDLVYLGANVNAPLYVVPGCDHILQCNFAIATHAVGYSRKGIERFLEKKTLMQGIGQKFIPVDMELVTQVQIRNKTYVVNPMLAFQRPGFSDVEKRDVDYKNFIQERFQQRLNELKNR